MKIKQVLTPNVERIEPSTLICDAASMMKQKDLGALPVYEGDRLTGMVTDRDIVIRAIAEDRDPKTTAVKEAMTPGVVYCFDDDEIRTAADLMREKKVRRLIVLNREKRLVGIVSLGDIAVEGDDRIAGKALEGVSQPVR
jgi:CBS domain-containing protein